MLGRTAVPGRIGGDVGQNLTGALADRIGLQCPAGLERLNLLLPTLLKSLCGVAVGKWKTISRKVTPIWRIRIRRSELGETHAKIGRGGCQVSRNQEREPSCTSIPSGPPYRPDVESANQEWSARLRSRRRSVRLSASLPSPAHQEYRPACEGPVWIPLQNQRVGKRGSGVGVSAINGWIPLRSGRSQAIPNRPRQKNLAIAKVDRIDIRPQRVRQYRGTPVPARPS